MRVLYSLLLYLLLPAVLLRLWLRGRSEPAYRRHWRERLGLDAPRLDGAIWIHAVSVGEVRAAEPLVRALRERNPQRPLLVTVTTPAGRGTVEQLFGTSVVCRYLPYDLPDALLRFLRSVRPAVLVVMEVELWPNLYAALAARGVPLYLVNARLSRKSFRRYRMLGPLTRETLARVHRIAAQTEADRVRFLQLGAEPERVTLVGNLKADIRLPEDFDARTRRLRETLSGRHPVWIAASTHEGEEAVALGAHAGLLAHRPDALLIVVPRHPERAAAVAERCRGEGFSCALSSEPWRDREAVLVVDELGVLMYYYALADAAFVGGSFVARGGHNPLEAIVAGTPVITGPHLDNFADIYAQLTRVGAVQTVQSPGELLDALVAWCDDDRLRREAVSAGQSVVAAHRGALERVLAVMDAGC